MDNANESKEQKSKRIVRSREHTAEEKRKEKKEWKKIKREAKRAMSETSVKIANDGTVGTSQGTKRKPPPSPKSQLVHLHKMGIKCMHPLFP